MTSPQRIAITGASGLIGTALVGHLKAEGHTVQRFVRRPVVAADEIQWDPQTGYVDIEALRGVDAVIHLAAQISVPDSLKDPKSDLLVNGFGTLNLVTAAISSGFSVLN